MEPVESENERGRTRHACERCRQKKTRCPGERPACSFCKRLNQQCVYGQREGPRARPSRRKIAKGVPSNDRVRALEAQVANLYNLLQANSCPGNASNSSPRRIVEDYSSPLRQGPGQGEVAENRLLHPEIVTPEFTDRESNTWSVQNAEPPEDVLDLFIEVYNTKIYFQPLPLFDVENLRSHLRQSPHFLQWSFFALCLHYTSHDFYANFENEAMRHYQRVSQVLVHENTMQGGASLEVVQTLCCLSLCDILDQRPSAWLNISMAARLESLQRLAVQGDPESSHDGPIHQRCYWSVVTLEKAFSVQFTLLDQATNTPDYPSSSNVPVPISSIQSYSRDLADVDSVNDQDAGINSHCLRALSAWGDVCKYIHGIRSGKTEDPWIPTSTFNRLTAWLYELEARIERSHFFRSVSFADRPLDSLEKDRGYWSPWLLMQLLSHSALAILNHPFIHLLALRNRKLETRPRLFLQHTVDQALFHSGWVARLISTCQDLGFTVYDPLIGQVVASIATIAWSFQFARDNRISTKAAEDMKKFERCLDSLSPLWPHLKLIQTDLKDLQAGAQNKRLDNASDRAHVSFQPFKMWKILDPNIIGLVTNSMPVPVMGQGSAQTPSDTIRVATKFVHPVVEDQSESHQSSTVEDVSCQQPNDLDEIPLAELLGDFFDPSHSWHQFQPNSSFAYLI